MHNCCIEILCAHYYWGEASVGSAAAWNAVHSSVKRLGVRQCGSLKARNCANCRKVEISKESKENVEKVLNRKVKRK